MSGAGPSTTDLRCKIKCTMYDERGIRATSYMTIHERYKNGNKIFIGLDSCANIHSVPYLPWLMHKCPKHAAIGTSGGDSSAAVSDDYTFETRTINDKNNKNDKITVRISRAFGLEGCKPTAPFRLASS